MFLNPGQGAAPVAAWSVLRPGTLMLVDRDLLALRVARANLVQNGADAATVLLAHQSGAHLAGAAPVDLVAGALRDDERPATQARLVDEAAAQLAPGGLAVVAGSSTAVARLEATIRERRLLRIAARQRRKGRGVLIMRRP
jgi:hypothetical protein